MVNRYVRPEGNETVCPSCGAAIKAPPSPRRRRVQCPKCREVVFIESNQANEPGPPAAPVPAAVQDVDAEQNARLDSLEARVEALEAALRDSMVADQPAGAGRPKTKLLWVSGEPGRGPVFSPEQGKVLMHNLGGVRKQAITIRTPAGDRAALDHAEWFKAVFQRAGWTVLGPEQIASSETGAGLSLAVPELPVAKEAAATYLALKAAGFEAIPVLDSALSDEPGGQSAAMVLTLPREKAA
jgi:hypothetical protein